jgi:hypothetical protein
MKHLLIIPCLFLCSCLVEEEEPENIPLSSPSIVVAPSSNSVEQHEPSILECPPEDIAEYPVTDFPENWMETSPPGSCPGELKMSKKELSFGAQGGVRCVTADRDFGVIGVTVVANSDNKKNEDCVLEEQLGWIEYKKIICPQLTATRINEQVLFISVNQNGEEVERRLNIHIASLYCGNSISITQSPN